MKHILWILMAAMALSCSNKNKAGQEEQPIEIEGNVITLSADAPVLKKMTLEAVKNVSVKREFSTSGIVKAIPARYAEIASPFAGRVTRSFVKLGQKLSPGSPVFEISSPSFFETGKAYFQAKQEMELALKALKREKDLLDNHVGVKKELEEAEVAYELRKKDYENALAALKVFQVSPEDMVPGQPLVVRAPIAGEVVKDDLVLGQYIREDAGPVVLIADLSKVWVVAHVKEKDIRRIQNLDGVAINLVAMPDDSFPGKVYHISEMLDENTRSVEVLVECDNNMRVMKPGMYGTVRLIEPAADAILIPATAVLQEEGHCYVLLALDDNRFRKQEIVTSGLQGDKIIVKSGLQVGDRIVGKGAFYLMDAR